MTPSSPSNRPSRLRVPSSTSTASTTSSNPSKPSRKNKPRLYIALYPRGGSNPSFTTCTNCDSYHWSLIVSPQTCSRSDPGTRYHIAHTHPSKYRTTTINNPSFIYEESDILTSIPASIILIRICIAKVLDLPTLQNTLRSIPISSPSKDHSYTCLTWTRAAYTALLTSSKPCLKSYLSVLDWKDIESCARKYCKRKREQRRFPFTNPNIAPRDLGCVSTYNFWENREIMS